MRLFERSLEANLLELRHSLRDHSYQHGSYRSFVVHDPKCRLIHVPIVCDQVVHQMIWNILFPFFNGRFSPSATSCRPDMGTSAARAVIRRWGKMPDTRFVLHMDVHKCFDSIPHDMLARRLEVWIRCDATMSLLRKVIGSFSSGRGIPLGNLTSQLFCNVVFLDVDRLLDSAVGVGNWVRYADDLFVRAGDKQVGADISKLIATVLELDGLVCRVDIRPYHGFEALGARWFDGGFESIARRTRARALWLASRRSLMFSNGSYSLHRFRSTFDSLRGLAIEDKRWTKCVQAAILEAV